MKIEFDAIVKQGIETKDCSIFGEHVERLCKAYGVSQRTLYSRFKSMFGDCPRGVITKAITPSKEQMIKLVLSSSSTEDVRTSLGLSQRGFVGIYDRFFGVSTFQKAKVLLLASKLPVAYKPNIDDNVALIYSQILGDGSYDTKRHALRIQHGEKQGEYLKWKVSLINKAYPSTNAVVKQRVHAQGHTYYDWYSSLGNIDIDLSVKHIFNSLTPLGWLLWYLDDGCYTQNVCICVPVEEVAEVAIATLKTYGIVARYEPKSMRMVMRGQENDVLFYKNFCEPFLNDLPICMKYKVEDIVGGLCI